MIVAFSVGTNYHCSKKICKSFKFNTYQKFLSCQMYFLTLLCWENDVDFDPCTCLFEYGNILWQYMYYFFLQSKALFTELILPLEQKLENEFKRSSVGIFHESRRSLFFIVQTFSALIECLFKHRLCNIDKKYMYMCIYEWVDE